MFIQAVKGLDYDGNFVNSESHSTRQNRPGQIAVVPAREGYRVFKYQKAEEAFAIGQVAMNAALIDSAVDVAAAQATTTKQVTSTNSFTANEFNDGTFPSAIVTVVANTGLNQTRSIFSNRGSASVLLLDSEWDTALDTTSDISTQDLNYVSLADTDDGVHFVTGVAVSAISDENWGWFQVAGYCPLVRSVGTTDAIIRGEGIVPSSTAGACRGFTNAATTADEVSRMFGMALHASADADSAGRGIAARLFCPFAIY